MAHRVSRSKSALFFVDTGVHPQTLAVLQTRAGHLGIELVSGDPLTELDGQAVFGALLQYPASDGSDPRPAPRHRRRPGPGRPRRRRQRPPGADAADPARRARCRHRPGLGPALRRADGLWRAARRVLRHQGSPQARHARPDHRRLGRQPRPAGPAHGAADPRAAHPPRQGDQQHLHRPGAAGGDRRLLRRLARAGGPDPDRAPRPRPDHDPGRRPARDRHRGRQRLLLRHADPVGPRPRPRAADRRPRRRHQSALRRRGPARPVARRDHDPPRSAPPAGRPRCRGRAHPGAARRRLRRRLHRHRACAAPRPS